MTEERAHAILIVEDEALLRSMLVDFLTECGFRVHEAANADDAMTALARADIEIDVLFTDVRMPGRLDGLGLARWVMEHRPNLPVLIASGDIGSANRDSGLCAGDRFFAKPYEFAAVERHIQKIVARTATPGQDL